MSDINEKIQDIEISMIFQDKKIDDLSEMVTAQWDVIEGLKRKIRDMESQMADMDSGGEGTPITKPPHY